MPLNVKGESALPWEGLAKSFSVLNWQSGDFPSCLILIVVPEDVSLTDICLMKSKLAKYLNPVKILFHCIKVKTNTNI